MEPAVFLDRDGVIIVDKDFYFDIHTSEFFPDTILALLSVDSRFRKVVISNQSGVARGLFTADDVDEFNEQLSRKLSAEGVHIDAWYFCPHGPDDGCVCRKPKPGMLVQAARELSLDLKNSWIIGDKTSDIMAGRAAGARTILVTTGYAGREPGSSTVNPDHSVDNLLQAVDLINRSVG